MKQRLLPVLGLAAALLATSTSHAREEDDDLKLLQTRLGTDWVLIKNDQRHNIKTYAKQEDGKRFRSFKVEATFDGTLESMTRLLTDFDHYERWSWNILHSELLKKVSPTEYYVYIVHDAPYGVPDRDIILHLVFEPQSNTRPWLTARFNAVPDYIPEKPPLVRMQAEDMIAKFTPLPDNKLLVTNEGYADPGGQMANWAINFVQRNAPYITLLGMRRMIQQSEYINGKTPLPFPVNNQP